jgi:peroxiredoxin Q/BCP
MVKLEKGSKAPDFKGIDQDGKTLQLNDFTGSKLIIYFYPKDDTPGCTAEACNLRDNYNMWLSKGYKIVGVSPDSQQSHKKFIAKFDLPFPLISDLDKKIIKDYGAWGMKKMYGKEYEGLLRTTIVIDEKGIIEQVITSVNTKEHSKQILENV